MQILYNYIYSILSENLNSFKALLKDLIVFDGVILRFTI